MFMFDSAGKRFRGVKMEFRLKLVYDEGCQCNETLGIVLINVLGIREKFGQRNWAYRWFSIHDLDSEGIQKFCQWDWA